MIELASYIDRIITNALNTLIPHNALFDAVFTFLSFQGSAIVIWIFIFAVLFIYKERKEKKFVVYFFAVMGITGIISEYILKNIFQRQRPISPLDVITKSCPYNFSFPSTHAALAFASAYTLAQFDPKRKVLYYGIAILICISRIYLYCHYFVDTLAGAVVGSIIAWSLMKLRHKYIQ